MKTITIVIIAAISMGVVTWIQCPTCKGSGWDGPLKCFPCQGDGKIGQ